MEDSALVRLARLTKVSAHRRRGLHGQTEHVDAYIRKDLDAAGFGSSKTRKGAFTGPSRATSGHPLANAPSDPVTLKFARRKDSVGQYGRGGFGQDVEPAGRYMVSAEEGGNFDPKVWSTGTVTFKRPLRIDAGGGYDEDSNWKRRLSEHYGGKTGKALSDAVRADGFDAIITSDKYGTGEIVDLGASPQPTINALRLPTGASEAKAPGEPQVIPTPRKRKGPIPPEEKVRIREKLAANPVAAENILDMYDQATPREQRVGREWYPDAHRIAQEIATEYGLDVRTVAGLIATYSPQKAWGRNLIEAAEVARTKKGIGGKRKDGNNTVSIVARPDQFQEKESGALAPESARRTADRILAGEDFQEVFAGKRLKNGGLPPNALKIRAFGELIARGGQDPDQDPPLVVVDRHAASVARGVRLTDDDYNIDGPSDSRVKFEVYATAYRDAAATLSKQQGRTVTPEEVQAVTWLARQRLNMADIAARRALGVQDVENSLNYFASYLPNVADIIDDPMVGYAALHPEEELRNLSAAERSLAEAGDDLREALEADDPLVNVTALSASGPSDRVLAALGRVFDVIDAMGEVHLSADDVDTVALAKITKVKAHRRSGERGQSEQVSSYVRKQLDPYGPGANAKTKAGAYAAKVASQPERPHKTGRGGNRVLKAKEVASTIERLGGKMVRQTGSHRLFTATYPGGTVKAVVPMHNGDMAPGTMRSVEKSMEPAFGPGWLTG